MTWTDFAKSAGTALDRLRAGKTTEIEVRRRGRVAVLRAARSDERAGVVSVAELKRDRRALAERVYLHGEAVRVSRYGLVEAVIEVRP